MVVPHEQDRVVKLRIFMAPSVIFQLVPSSFLRKVIKFVKY